LPTLCAPLASLVHVQGYNERPYPCTIGDCTKRFHDVSALNRHKLTHADERPVFPCTFEGCTKTFQSERTRLNHERLHTGTAFPCPVEGCTRVFAVLHQLQLHQVRHTGERNFICETCGKRYYDKHRLRQHMQGHAIFPNGMQYFTCPVEGCTRTFKTRISLEKHRHNSTLAFRCTYDGCGRAFAEDRNLKSHMRRSHRAPGPDGLPVLHDGDEDDEDDEDDMDDDGDVDGEVHGVGGAVGVDVVEGGVGVGVAAAAGDGMAGAVTEHLDHALVPTITSV
jgi:general transcription factor IIIA